MARHFLIGTFFSSTKLFDSGVSDSNSPIQNAIKYLWTKSSAADKGATQKVYTDKGKAADVGSTSQDASEGTEVF